MKTEFENSLEFARKEDQMDQLAPFREKFYFPVINQKQALYFTGNSLGLQPKTTQDYVLNELEDWAAFGVEGHFHARHPWYSYHEILAPGLSRIAGALEKEVVAMNQLTVNLHLLMVSFYRPNKNRYKIICEAKAFPSDQYAIETQVKFHGFNPDEAIIEVAPRIGESTINHTDIIEAIEKAGESLALVLIGGVNYFTGQVLPIPDITSAAHKVGALAGFDLAHAAGNIPLQLHKWNVDFACWCSYKYLNAGPGGVAAAFVHEKHLLQDLPRFAGWWGHDKESRFKMEKGFKPIPSAESWQLSNAPVLSMAALKASLDIFDEAGIQNLNSKSIRLTDYLEFLIHDLNQRLNLKNGVDNLEIITPSYKFENDIPTRGCQISIVAHGRGRKLYDNLLASSVIADWREPNVIRVAPVPLYNSFEDVYSFSKILEHFLIHS